MSILKDLQRDALERQLRTHLEGEVRFDEIYRRLYSTDASIYQMKPLGVVIPLSVNDVQVTMQICHEMRIPITARGGGTSLSGQSIGPGIVIDVSKHLNQIEEIDREARFARVQPGVVLDQLNRAVGNYGLQFGPDVATANRANLGGMIGNNSAGARSIVYGKTIDHVRRLDVILADGHKADLAPMTQHEWDQRARQDTPEGRLYRECQAIVTRHRDEIGKRFPRILRRVSGYNLDALQAGLSSETPAWRGLHSLVVGSEGTLALITGAELDLISLPKHRGLLVPQFATLTDAMNALAVCLSFRPSAVELMDHLLIQLSSGNIALRDVTKMIESGAQALFMVEMSGDDPREIADRIERLEQRLQEVPGLMATVQAIDPSMREPLWNLRRAAMPLLYSMPGDAKPITFVEDCAVDPARLPELVARFRDVLKSHDTDGSFYGHASVGCLHVRPVLNIKSPLDVAKMRRIAERISDLVLEFGGSLSGEHGDGMVRSEWNEKMFGPEIYQAFRQIKHLFDPQHLLNPGKIVDAAPMTENLRYSGDYHPQEPVTLYDYSKQDGFVRSIEMCNGSGACRKTQGGTMCPSYRATLDEKDSTRGRANALRLAMVDEAAPKSMQDRRLYDVLDLCLMCKACKSECPSNVDVAKLKTEFLQFYYTGRSRPLGHRLMGNVHRLNRRGAKFAPFVNLMQRSRLFRWLLEKTCGIDRRRTLPRLRFNHLRRWFAKRRPPSEAGRLGKVLLLDDCFTTFNEPAIGRAAVHVLESVGYKVELANIECCGRALISKGFLREAQELVAQQAPDLHRRIADGTPILGLEPSCLLTLADDWTELVPSESTRVIAERAHLAEGWLVEQIDNQRIELELKKRPQECVFHGHCHQKALRRDGASVQLVRMIPELYVDVLDAGCCGMAGSFGYEREHYDVSVKIANLELLPALDAKPEALIVAPGTSCRHQIRDLDGRRALHPIEVIAEQI